MGLSYTPNNHKPLSQVQQHREGRRILALLDRNKTSQGLIQTSASGKPYFSDHHAAFSISHSKAAVGVALTTEKNGFTGLPATIGFDLQYVSYNIDIKNIAKRFYASEEQGYINAAQTDKEKRKRFFQLWTIKECFFKMNGFSLFEIEQSSISLLLQTVFYLYEYSDGLSEAYLLAVAKETVAGNKSKELPEPLWFSESTLTLKNASITTVAQLLQ